MAKGKTEELNFIFKCFDGFLKGFVQQKKWFLQSDNNDIPNLSGLLNSILDQCPKVLKNERKGESPFGKWEEAINQNTNESTKLCFKYIVWFWNLPDSETISDTKNKCIDGIITDYCFPNEKWGIGGAKPRSQKPQEIKYLVKLLLNLSNVSFNSVDDIKYSIVENIRNGTGLQDDAIVDEIPLKNALLYLCKPDEYEPIFSNGHKLSIVKAFPELSADKDIDKALIQIRKALMLSEDEGFYCEDIRAIWGGDDKDANGKLRKKNDLLNKIKMKQYKSLVEKNHNLILTGAPGTGKTYLAKEIAKLMTIETNENNHPHYEMVQFHPSYDYSDFVEGLRPVKKKDDIGFERKDGVFKAFCKKALNDGYHKTEEGWAYNGEKSHKYVFIIDEINRGEMSKIFGELFFSIDPGYRGTKGRIKTQYQNLVDKEYDEKRGEENDDVFKDGFFVPENVYIIGTMNDIDRSVESMDFAMRRRFAFKEIKATDRVDMWNDKDQLSSDIIKMANSLMRSLNCAIEQIPGLTSAYHVGPSYFLKLKEFDEEELWTNSLEGLLFEYLRGMPDADTWLSKLKDVYFEAKNNQFDGDLTQERKDAIQSKMKS